MKGAARQSNIIEIEYNYIELNGILQKKNIVGCGLEYNILGFIFDILSRKVTKMFLKYGPN